MEYERENKNSETECFGIEHLKSEPQYLKFENIENDGRLFSYNGKLLAVPTQFVENYASEKANTIPFAFDITFDVKEFSDKNLTCGQALQKLGYVVGTCIDDSKFMKDFTDSVFDSNHDSLDKFHAYQLADNSDHPDYCDLKIADEANGFFYNGLGQGYQPSDLDVYRKIRPTKTIDDVFPDSASPELAYRL